MIGSGPGSVRTRVSDPWGMASSETSNSCSFWGGPVFVTESSAVPWLYPRGGPHLRRGILQAQSLPAPQASAVLPCCKGHSVPAEGENGPKPCGFLVGVDTDKHLFPQNISLVSLRLVQSLFECLASQKQLELCATAGLGRADWGFPSCCFPLFCQIKSCSKSGATLLPAL